MIQLFSLISSEWLTFGSFIRNMIFKNASYLEIKRNVRVCGKMFRIEQKERERAKSL